MITQKDAFAYRIKKKKKSACSYDGLKNRTFFLKTLFTIKQPAKKPKIFLKKALN